MIRSTLFALTFSGFALAAPAAAQVTTWPPPVAFSIRGEFAVPLGGFANELGQDAGFGLGVLARATVAPPLSVYAGFDQFRFDGATTDGTFRVRDTGFRGGVQVTAPTIQGGWATPFALAGVTYTEVAIDRTTTAPTNRYRSGRDPGYEIGGGVALMLTHRFWFVPEARYRSRLSDVQGPLGGTSEMPVHYLGINLGLMIRIP
jgi:hypothetical protein